jgi:hypothetical protein
MLLNARLQPHGCGAAAVSSPPDSRVRPTDVQPRFTDAVMTQPDDAGAQCAPGVLLVRPAHFGYNGETAASNRFQQPAQWPDTVQRARREFDALAAAIHAAGVSVCVVDDSSEPAKPDAVFPNNWVSFHRDGTIVLYPMQAPNRRAERRMEIVAAAEQRLGFRRRRLLDLSRHEQQGRALEGTGSLVLDYVHKVAYACVSSRTDPELVREWAQRMDYEPLLFDARGSGGVRIYHTNVMLSIGARWAVVCAEAIDDADRARVLQRLGASGREIIPISLAAMAAFAANILELRGIDAAGGERSVLLLSEQARSALRQLDPQAWERLCGRVDQIVASAIPTIESVGGGSVRCMLAEVPTADA